MEKLKISLLYVEDDAPIREIQARMLNEMVETIYTAKDGVEGLEKYIKHKPDLTITDIMMPRMNGLDMIKEIKAYDKNAKTVIISAYDQTHIILRAVDDGVNGFLTKPTTVKKFKELVLRIGKDILIEKNAIQTQITLKNREAILESVTFASKKFLSENYSQEILPEILEKLGKATNASRVYVFKKDTDLDGLNHFQQISEWCKEGIEPQIDNPKLQKIYQNSDEIKTMMTALEKREIFTCQTELMDATVQKFLQLQNIKSLILIPVYLKDNWWGFFGIDECDSPRNWSEPETQALKAAANIFGAAIYRKLISNELEDLNETLEKRISERTEELSNEILERQSIEKDLRESEEKYRLIIDNANDGVFLTIDGIIQFINPKLTEMTGYFPRDLIRKPFITFVENNFQEIVRENLMKATSAKISQRDDIQIQNTKGEYHWYEIKSVTIEWEHQNAVLSILSDITERKRADIALKKRLKEEKEKLNKQLKMFYQKSKLETLGELAAGTAHEIRQPLSTLASGLENLQNKLNGKNPVSQEYIDKKFNGFDDDINRINDQVENIRKFSRDQKYDNQRAFDANESIQAALDSVIPRFKDANIKYDFKIDTRKSTSYGKRTNLQQVITNVLINARQAVNKKEREIKDVSYVKEITIDTWNKDDNICIVIEDNGIGIPKKYQNNIFDPYFTTKDVDEGTGMGLSISYGLITDMKGDISVSSKEGEYTRIIITLPVYHQA
ncbi:MAG: ATP-binding protein [Bacteroidales bacterium]